MTGIVKHRAFAHSHLERSHPSTPRESTLDAFDAFDRDYHHPTRSCFFNAEAIFRVHARRRGENRVRCTKRMTRLRQGKCGRFRRAGAAIRSEGTSETESSLECLVAPSGDGTAASGNAAKRGGLWLARSHAHIAHLLRSTRPVPFCDSCARSCRDETFIADERVCLRRVERRLREKKAGAAAPCIVVTSGVIRNFFRIF